MTMMLAAILILIVFIAIGAGLFFFGGQDDE